MDSRGMTLMELIVVLAVASIIIATAGSIILSSYRIFGSIAQTNHDKLVGDSVYEFICDKIIFTYFLEIVNSQKIVLDDEKVLETSDGRLVFDGKDVYSSDFYDGMSLSMNIERYGSDGVKLHISVMRGEKQSYSTGSVVRLLNFGFPDE